MCEFVLLVRSQDVFNCDDDLCIHFLFALQLSDVARNLVFFLRIEVKGAVT